MAKEVENPKWPEGQEIVNDVSVTMLNNSTKNVKLDVIKDKVQKTIDEAQKDIDHEFEKVREVSDYTNRRYFISKNEFWDLWLQKLFAQIISVKLWVMALITVLLMLNAITNIQFAALFGIIMGLKGTFQVASVWKDKTGNVRYGGERNINAMDKT